MSRNQDFQNVYLIVYHVNTAPGMAKMSSVNTPLDDYF